jgi:hypothetical protein
MAELHPQQADFGSQSSKTVKRKPLNPPADDFNASTVEKINENAPTGDMTSNYIKGWRLHTITVA